MRKLVAVGVGLVLLLAPSLAFAAVAFDTSTNFLFISGVNTSISSNNHTVAAGNPSLFTFIYANQSLPSLACTYNSVAMTQVATLNQHGTVNQYIFDLPGPTTGSALPVVCTYSSTNAFVAIQTFSYTGATQSVPTNIQITNTGTSVTSFTTSLTTSSTANAWVVMFAVNESGTFVAGSGTTFRNQVAGQGIAWADSNGTVAASTPYSMAASWPSSALWDNIQIELDPFVAPVSVRTSIIGLVRAFWLR